MILPKIVSASSINEDPGNEAKPPFDVKRDLAFIKS